MIRNLLSIALYIIAGFLFYTVSLLSFISGSTIGSAKWWMLLIFMVPALVALCGGLALKRFHHWKRTTGIVLLSASGFMVFLVFTLVCLLMTEEFRIMMTPDTLASFNDYLSGGLVTVGLGVLGFLLFKTDTAPSSLEDSP